MTIRGRWDVPAGLTGVVAISAGAYHSLALKSDGTVVTWGQNGDPQLAVPAGLTDMSWPFPPERYIAWR